MFRKYAKTVCLTAFFGTVLSVCFVFVKTLRDDAKEADRIFAVHGVIQCGIAKMSTAAKDQVALAEHQRQMARLAKDDAGAAAAEAITAPIFAALVDACEPQDREQRRESIGWFRYALEHDAEYRTISAPLRAQYQQALDLKITIETPSATQDSGQRQQNMAWIFKT